MRARRLILSSAGWALFALAVPAVASAAPFAPVTGALDQPGYTVIALGTRGETATTVPTPDGGFAVVPPVEVVTLHLRAPDGTYAGPVLPRETGARRAAARRKVTAARLAAVRARRAVTAARRALRRADGPAARRRAATQLRKARARRTRANRKLTTTRRRLRTLRAAAANQASSPSLGIRAGAPLGTIRVNAAGGYAVAGTLDATAWKQWVDRTRTAQGQLGVPIGAGNFGRVLSSLRDGAAIGDLDLDGLPTALDVDDDGDLILDDADSSPTARASTVGGTFRDGTRIQVYTHINAGPEGAASAAGGSTDEQIGAAQVAHGEFDIRWIGLDPESVELDCGSLVYCSLGGTGLMRTDPVDPSRAAASPFPACCDADGDGFGTLTHQSVNYGPPLEPDQGALTLLHGATADQIGTGDVLILRGTVNGVPTEAATTVGFAFSTPPALAGYSDGQGNTQTFTYPRPASPPPSPVRAGPDGDVVLALTVWRPERTRIDGDEGTGRWIDMGHLSHMLGLFMPDVGPSLTSNFACPQSTLSESDANLVPAPSPPFAQPFPNGGGFVDEAADRSADPANTFAYTVNLTQCLASNGVTLASGDRGEAGLLALATGSGELATAVSSLRFEVQ